MQCESRGYEEEEYMLRAQYPRCKFCGGVALAGSPGPNTHERLVCSMYIFGGAVLSEPSSCAPGPLHSNNPSAISNDNQEIHHKSSLLTLL